jgi:hypothetical protein
VTAREPGRRTFVARRPIGGRRSIRKDIERPTRLGEEVLTRVVCHLPEFAEALTDQFARQPATPLPDLSGELPPEPQRVLVEQRLVQSRIELLAGSRGRPCRVLITVSNVPFPSTS